MDDYTKHLTELSNKPNICASCIYLFDESSITCCIKNDRWKNVDVEETCDIEAWEGYEL